MYSNQYITTCTRNSPKTLLIQSQLKQLPARNYHDSTPREFCSQC